MTFYSQALGYMCDSMDPDTVDTNVVNQILSSIVDGMRADRRSDIRLAAVVALNNSLDFTGKNFENATERDAIMRAICEATQSPDIKIRERAFECFCTVGELYYDKLQPYFDTLFQLTTNAIRTDDQKVGMQAIEFWSTICDQELNILDDIADEVEVGVFLRIVEQASASLVPLMLENMTKQVEDLDDDDNWNISMAAATCLEAIARTIDDKVVDLVLPFVTQNINNSNWRLKEAAVMAFGMILDGPSSDKLSPIVMQAMPILINCLKDPHALVRDTSAWTIGKICELHKSSLSNDVLPHMVEGLSLALNDKVPKVVSQACYAVHNLAEACCDESEANSNVLSHFMQMMLGRLLTVTTREDWESDNIRSTAYEAINMMVANSALDMQPTVLQLFVEAMNRLDATFKMQNPQERMNLQSCLCSLLGEIIKKLDMAQLAPHADRAMQLLFTVFNTKGAVAHEDAFMAIGFMAEKMEANFTRYVSHLHGPLIQGLKNIEEYQVCTVSVGVVGDLCRALGTGILPYCDDIMKCLLELLQSQALNRSVKPHVISLFADIAMAIEGEFERYTSIILGILRQAGEVNMVGDDEDMIDYINTLRNSILEAYTGIIQGLKSANKQDSVWPAIESIIEFLQRSAMDENRSDEVLKSAVGLIGDLGQTFGAKMIPVFNQPFIQPLILQGISYEEIKDTAKWAQQVSGYMLY